MKSRVFDVSVGQAPAGIVITCTGEIDISSIERLQQVLDDVAARRPRSVTLDLSDLAFIDSSGIRVLVLFARRCARDAIAMRTFASDAVRRVTDVLGVTEAIGVSGDVTGRAI
jgi:anti-anti-sigma factor